MGLRRHESSQLRSAEAEDLVVGHSVDGRVDDTAAKLSATMDEARVSRSKSWWGPQGCRWVRCDVAELLVILPVRLLVLLAAVVDFFAM